MIEKLWFVIVGEGGRFLTRPDGPLYMRVWVGNINQILSHRSNNTKIVKWFANNGNFVLHSPIGNIRNVTDLFCSCTGHKAVVLSISELYWLIQEIRSIPDLNLEEDSVWNKGAGFQLKGKKRYFEDFQVGQNSIRCIKPGIVGVNRIILSNLNITNEDRKLRPKWAQVVRDLNNSIGGEWTARSLPVLNGLFERALLYLSQQ